jgi:hypothetical protein
MADPAEPDDDQRLQDRTSPRAAVPHRALWLLRPWRFTDSVAQQVIDDQLTRLEVERVLSEPGRQQGAGKPRCILPGATLDQDLHHCFEQDEVLDLASGDEFLHRAGDLLDRDVEVDAVLVLSQQLRIPGSDDSRRSRSTASPDAFPGRAPRQWDVRGPLRSLLGQQPGCFGRLTRVFHWRDRQLNREECDRPAGTPHQGARHVHDPPS